jgi:hypothetical protein
MDGASSSHSNTELVKDATQKNDEIEKDDINKVTANVKDPDACTICLQPISDRAVAVPCNHLTFDYVCLRSWLAERPTCPLCKTTVIEVQWDFVGPTHYQLYRVPQRKEERGFTNGDVARRHAAPRRDYQRWSAPHSTASISTTNPALERRRRVYRGRLYSLHIGANAVSGHRDINATTFAHSQELQSRARAFLRRELSVFGFLERVDVHRGGTKHYLMEYVVAMLKTNELKDASGHAEDLVAEFLGRDNARLLLHELEAWLRSPYARVEEWDEHVQYAGESRGPKA